MAATQTIVAIPDPARTMEGLRDTGYNFDTAVADLLDNSISAGATEIDIQVRQDFRGRIRISIADNGHGMDRETLIQAMQYGSPKRQDPASLGKFGLGLKTASTAFCRRLSVISRSDSSKQALMATWDLDEVIMARDWLLELSEKADKDALDHLNEVAPERAGTVILWTKVDRLIGDYKQPSGVHAQRALEKHCTGLNGHIAKTYQRFLDKRDARERTIRIRLNGQYIDPWDPFQEGLSQLVAEDTAEVADSMARFTVRAFLLPRREEFPDDKLARLAKLSSNLQGLYIYREGRLIHDADWLGMFQKEPHATLLRVEFSFDHRLDDEFHLDIKKSRITLSSDLWNWLRDQFLTAPRREAIRRYRQGTNRRVREMSKNVHDVSNQSIRVRDADIGGAKVDVKDANKDEVTITNRQGTFDMKLRIVSASKPGEVYVQPSANVDDGCLFEPVVIDQCRAVRINTQHPYYHKVYVPNHNRSVTIQGMDSLLWALCVAELTATTDKTAEAFKDMRYEVTRILRKLSESLPDPEVDDNVEET